MLARWLLDMWATAPIQKGSPTRFGFTVPALTLLPPSRQPNCRQRASLTPFPASAWTDSARANAHSVAMVTRVGISGWRYKGWRGSFYPPDLPQRAELSYAAEKLGTIELNGSFYSLQTLTSYRRWYAETPAGFVFAVKGPRFITHVKRLRDIEAPLANFFASGLLALEEKLGPLLWQFPGNLRWDPGTFEAFLAFLPRTTEKAAAIAARHDHRVADPCANTARSRPLRHAVEVRHESFINEAFIAQLRRHEVALVIADTAGKFLRIDDVTADFLYLRLHGDTQLYTSGYSEAALREWAGSIEHWAHGKQPKGARCCSANLPVRRKQRDLYVYFDNDAKTHAPFDAMSLQRMLGRRADASMAG